MSISLLSVYRGVQVQSLPARVLTEEILSPSVSVRGCIMKMLDHVAHSLERQQGLDSPVSWSSGKRQIPASVLIC